MSMSAIILSVLLFVAVSMIMVLGKEALNKSDEVARLNRRIRRMQQQNHVEFDLSLATVEQIVEEMSSRPNLQFILLLPKGDAVDTHAYNMSSETATKILRKGVDIVQRKCDPN